MAPQSATVPAAPALLLDLYELTIAQSYFDHGMHAPATFSLFARHLPPGWGYFVAAGLDDVLTYLETLAFDAGDLDYLRSTGLFTEPFLALLGRLRFTGSVRALEEGTVFFPNEPVLEVTAPIIEAQIVETVVFNQVHLQTIIASKAARCVEAAQGQRLVDFSLRRTHGTDAGLKVARCAYLAGFDATSNVLAAQRYGIPPAGTMAHSYVRAFPDETAAFRAFAETYPDGTILLVDTYDTLEGTRQAARVGRELAAAGHHLGGVRLDSGDLVALSFDARRILDEAGLCDATIFVSGSLDEHEIARAVTSQAPIDGFGVGSRLGVSADAPYLDMAYKLVADAGEPTLKLSAGKATWPGPKQVWRICQGGIITQDWITRLDEPPIPEAEPLLVPVMQQGKRLTEQTEETLATARVRLRREVAALPATCRRLAGPESPAVHFSPALIQVRERLASHIVRGLGQTAAA
ncbi:MAG: nicotinate phosphoribosyltransferase [Chloroflexi bacterium]|nr:nicotinate phosphoribosyltransferase [Chloroflexota bacterium]